MKAVFTCQVCSIAVMANQGFLAWFGLRLPQLYELGRAVTTRFNNFYNFFNKNVTKCVSMIASKGPVGCRSGLSAGHY
jgi:hypothetical protein